MWVLFLLLFLLLLLPLSVHMEDLGKLSTNPAGLSGLFSLSGYLISLVIQSANPMNETNQTNKINQFRPYGPRNPYSPTGPTNTYGRALRIECQAQSRNVRFMCSPPSPVFVAPVAGVGATDDLASA
jgi:hypothetical protein